MKKPLVTLVSPVYNGETYISRYLDSVLNQDYDNIELILVNDGSTDNTEKIIKKYQEKLIEKLTKFVYIKKENGGVCSAVEEGLKYVHGDFLTWPDTDDILTNDSISRKTYFLMQNKRYGLVMSEAFIVNESDINNVIGFLKRSDVNNTNIFEDYLFEKDIYYAPICYMVRTECLRKVLPSMKIIANKYGQNWQLILPLLSKYECGYIPEKLAYYLVRNNSISHNDSNEYIKKIDKYDIFEKLLVEIIDTLEIASDYKETLKNKIIEKYSILRLHISIENLNQIEFDKNYNKLKEIKKLSLLFKIYNFLGVKLSKKLKSIKKIIRGRKI